MISAPVSDGRALGFTVLRNLLRSELGNREKIYRFFEDFKDIRI